LLFTAVVGMAIAPAHPDVLHGSPAIIAIAMGAGDCEQHRDLTGDPWDGRTLEWSTSSPPPPWNFAAGYPGLSAQFSGDGFADMHLLAGPALEAIKVGKSYYGEVPILGTPYITGYEPIMDSSGAQVGVYYVGYKK
jgi:Single cache domain 3